MKADRFFYTLAGGVFLLLMLVGFRAFYTHGTGLAGRRIDPVIFTVVLVHGLAIAAWFVLFFVQALLISVRNRRLHMKLGWGVLGIGLAITCTGTLVAIRSVQVSPPIHFFGMEYARFLLVMLTEIAAFTIFVAVGVLARRKPKIHRPMMLLASLTLLAGATVRIPSFYPLFGTTGWIGLFGAVFCLGAALLLFRCLLTRSFDRWFAAAYAVWVCVFIASTQLALTDTWSQLAAQILRL
jgi:hypothetical protein